MSSPGMPIGMMPNQPNAGMVQPQNPMMAPPGVGMQPHMAKGGPLHRAAGGVNPGLESSWFERREATDAGSGANGFLHGSTPGRADALRTTAPSGSYVLPADVVSGLGEGNSMNGAAHIQRALSSGPFGTALPRGARGSGPPRPPSLARMKAKGGGVQKDGADGHPIPVLLSHGEFVVSPEHVKAIGGGSSKNGWKILDEFVKEARRRTIAKMQKLPGPAK